MDDLAGLDNEVEIARRDLSAPIGVLPKRIIDIALALSGIILLAPLLVICYLLTIATSPGPVLFRHRRVGFNGKHFDCLKFRTMLVDAPERLHHLLESDPMAAREWAETRKLRRDPRITAIGAILRKSSLDELPQLFNVLKGDMSIVGPRPITDEELERYSASVGAYLDLTPEDEAFVEMKLALTKLFREHRARLHLTQEQAAQLVGTGQARIAKIEAGHKSVGFDLIMRGLLKIGAPPREIGQAICRIAAHRVEQEKPSIRANRGQNKKQSALRAT